jgi:Putative Flp pilus-assembly TadE/G-like
MEKAMRNRKEAGQALILTAAALVALMGFAGLAIDVGMLRYEKRLQQTAADAAAIAGASNLAFGGVTEGAQDAASRIGYTDNGGGLVSNCAGATVGTICIQVNSVQTTGGPLTGPHLNNPSYVEVLVAVVHPTYFMKILGINTETITARSVASNLGGNGCLYTLGTPPSSIEGDDDAAINAISCTIVDNGNFNINGTDLDVSAYSISVSGPTSGATATCTTSGPCPTFAVPAAADPLSTLTPPCTSCSGGNTINVIGGGNGNCGTGCVFNGGTYTISPGTYCSITIQGGASDHVVFSPGVYIIDGTSAGCPSSSLNIQGNDTITGTGLTFYFTNSSTLNMSGRPNINLTAPDSTGTYPGILMYQDPIDTNKTSPGPTVRGKSGSKYKGALYFPKDQLTFKGNTDSMDVTVVVSDSINMNGSPTVNVQGNAGLPPGVSLIKNATLVE